MKRTMLRLMLAIFGVLAFNGCALMSTEDRDFYGKGWLNPKELDDQPLKMPAHPETTGALTRPAMADPILDE